METALWKDYFCRFTVLLWKAKTAVDETSREVLHMCMQHWICQRMLHYCSRSWLQDVASAWIFAVNFTISFVILVFSAPPHMLCRFWPVPLTFGKSLRIPSYHQVAMTKTTSLIVPGLFCWVVLSPIILVQTSVIDFNWIYLPRPPGPKT